MSRPTNSILVIAVSAFVVSCSPNDAASTADRDQKGAPAVASATTDSWLGRWIGPEGTYLKISGGKGSYEITIMDLDRARTFQGTTVRDHIEFQRDGTNESLNASNGDGTGMKWLAGKTDCLRTKPGEGFCRD